MRCSPACPPSTRCRQAPCSLQLCCAVTRFPQRRRGGCVQADGRSEQTLQRILKEKPKFPASFPREAKSFVLALLEQDSSKRLGCLENGVQDIMTHPWFAPTDWQAMAERRVDIKAMAERGDAWVPPSKSDGDTQNFDDYEGYNPAACRMAISASEERQFADFC